jgi:hypothetical protein
VQLGKTISNHHFDDSSTFSNFGRLLQRSSPNFLKLLVNIIPDCSQYHPVTMPGIFQNRVGWLVCDPQITSTNIPNVPDMRTWLGSRQGPDKLVSQTVNFFSKHLILTFPAFKIIQRFIFSDTLRRWWLLLWGGFSDAAHLCSLEDATKTVQGGSDHAGLLRPRGKNTGSKGSKINPSGKKK